MVHLSGLINGGIQGLVITAIGVAALAGPLGWLLVVGLLALDGIGVWVAWGMSGYHDDGVCRGEGWIRQAGVGTLGAVDGILLGFILLFFVPAAIAVIAAATLGGVSGAVIAVIMTNPHVVGPTAAV